MNTPVATERKSFLPLRLRSATVVGSSNIPTPSRSITSITTPMPLSVQNDSKSSFAVGNRVLVNGLKIGTLRYTGVVQFAQGLFCGVELDDPEGKHDGQVNDIRYFQCQTNHGIFVPHDKVVLAPRERALSSHRVISRLRPPGIARSMTLSSPVNDKIDLNPVKTSLTHVQLPDIIPSRSSTPTQSISIIKTTNVPIINDDHEIMTPTEESKLFTKPIFQPQSIIIDEAPETIEADFTDSVSLILHQLQQEQKSFSIEPRGSIAISEESIIDDDEDHDDTDEMDTGSIAESSMSEKIHISHHLSFLMDTTKSVQTDLSFDTNDNMLIIQRSLLDSNSLSSSYKSVASSTTSMNKLQVDTTDNKANINKRKASIPTSVGIVKKDLDRNTSTKLTNTLTASRRSSLIPPKKGLPTMTKQNPTKPTILLGSQSKLNQSLSPSNSVGSSHSDLTSKLASKSTSGTTRMISHSIDLGSDKKPNSYRRSLDTSDHQLMIQKIVIQSLESTNEHLKKQYQHLLNQFDVMCILSGYYITENEQIKQQYELKLSKPQIENRQLKNLIEQMKISHKNELNTLDEQYRNQIDTIKELHKQESVEYQQQIDKLSKEKLELEIHCTSLQGQVDRFLEEMTLSEHADPLLRRVEILEKDNTSLQTVLEIKNQELTQLRTKINEQVFQREDQIALQKRIDMAENRNQDLVCLLRNWQLNEKAVVVERDQLKEEIAQLERDNSQLTFENETLLYRLRQRSSTVSLTSKLSLNSRATQKVRERAHSFSSIITTPRETQILPRSLSLNHI